MKFRHITPADRPAMAEIIPEVDRYFNGLTGEETCTLNQQELEKVLDLSLGEDPVVACLLAEADNKILGYMAYYFGCWEMDRAFYIAGLFIRPGQRGQGLGQTFMEQARELAKTRNASEIVWDVWEKNPRAISFYENLGATRTEEMIQMSLSVEE